MEWMLLPLRRYAEFTGRSRPREYWMFVLFIILVSVLLTIADLVLGFGTTSSESISEPGGFWASWNYASSGGPLLLVFSLAIIIPSIAVAVRRLHDSDRSGWWLLLALIPFIGGIVVLIFMIIGGTHGPNRFGPDPVAERNPIGI